MQVTYEAHDLDEAIRRRGAVTLSVFALVWAVTGVLALPVRPLLGAGAAALATAAVLVVARRASPPPRPRRLPENWRRTFNTIGLIQGVVIAATVAGLIAVQLPEAIPAVVCSAVGLHFLPLRRVFDQPQYAWTGSALIAIAAVGLVSLPVLGSEVSHAAVGIGAAVSLLLTALAISLANDRQRASASSD